MLSSAREPKSANNYGISKLMSFTHVVAVFVAVRSVLRDSLLFMENQNKGQLDHLRDTLLQVERFHSRDQLTCKLIGTKGSIYIRKELNSHRTGLVHQHGRRFIVLEHQYGCRDVM